MDDVDSLNKQGIDLARLDFIEKLPHLRVVACSLVGRAAQVNSRSVGVQQMIQQIRQGLQLDVLNAAHHEAAPARVPQTLRQLVQALRRHRTRGPARRLTIACLRLIAREGIPEINFGTE